MKPPRCNNKEPNERIAVKLPPHKLWSYCELSVNCTRAARAENDRSSFITYGSSSRHLHWYTTRINKAGELLSEKLRIFYLLRKTIMFARYKTRTKYSISQSNYSIAFATFFCYSAKELRDIDAHGVLPTILVATKITNTKYLTFFLHIFIKK